MPARRSSRRKSPLREQAPEPEAEVIKYQSSSPSPIAHSDPLQEEIHNLHHGSHVHFEDDFEETISADERPHTWRSLNTSRALPTWAIPFVVPMIQGILSAFLYTLVEPINTQLIEGLVGIETRNWAFDITRLALPGWLALANGLDAFSSGIFMFLIKTPFYSLLLFFYGLPFGSFIINPAVDGVSLGLAMYLCGFTGQASRQGYVSQPGLIQLPEISNVLQNRTNGLLVLILSSAIFAVGVKAVLLSDPFLPFMVSNFYPIESLDRAHEMNTFSLGFAFILVSLATHYLLYSHPAVFRRFSPILISSPWTSLIFGRIEVLFLGVIFENTLRIVTTVGGATWNGALVWTAIWAGLYGVQGVVLAWVEAGAISSETDT